MKRRSADRSASTKKKSVAGFSEKLRKVPHLSLFSFICLFGFLKAPSLAPQRSGGSSAFVQSSEVHLLQSLNTQAWEVHTVNRRDLNIWWESDSQFKNTKGQILWRRARKFRTLHFARCSDTHWYGTHGKTACVLDDECVWLWYLVMIGWYLDPWHHQGKEQSGDWDRPASHSAVQLDQKNPPKSWAPS